MNFSNCSQQLLVHLPTSILSGILFIVIPSCSSSANIEQSVSSPTNMEVMVRLTQNIAQSLVQDAEITSADTCEVRFARIENLQFVEHSFVESLRRLTAYVRTNSPRSEQSVSVEIQPSRADVVYEKTFRDGLFAEKKAVRVVSVEFSAKVVKKPAGNVVFAGVRKDQFRDTVLISSIERLESPMLKATQASLPSGSLFDRFVEPLVVLAATGVVIYLFFTVRS